MTIIKTTARDLRDGDLLLGSGTTIIGPPQRGVRTPPRKVELTVRRRNGKVARVEWNASTTMTVRREDA